MTILKNKWIPELSFGDIPKYQSIANAISDAIHTGALKVGDKMPTHRDLAWDLEVTVGTVSRAYAEIERRGLIGGEVGRGTYVRDLNQRPTLNPARSITPDVLMPKELPETGPINLSHNFPPPSGAVGAMRRMLRELAEDPHLSSCMDYQPHAGMDRHREAGRLWVKKRGLDVSADNVLVTPGAHNAALNALAAITNPGDTVLIERLTFPGAKAIAGMLNLRLVAVDMDAEGLRPDAFLKACEQEKPKALYCVPTLQNPTNAIMSESRMKDIAAIAERHGVYIIEDDIFALLLDSPSAPLSSFLPDQSFLVTSVSKTLSPGSRTGFLTVPKAHRNAVIAAIRASCWMAPPLGAEITARWIMNGTADQILANNKSEAAKRRELYGQIIGFENTIIPQGALHAWLQLPPSWSSQSFAGALLHKGVILSPADSFAIPGDDIPAAIRVCLGSPKGVNRLEHALNLINETLQEDPNMDNMSLV